MQEAAHEQNPAFAENQSRSPHVAATAPHVVDDETLYTVFAGKKEMVLAAHHAQSVRSLSMDVKYKEGIVPGQFFRARPASSAIRLYEYDHPFQGRRLTPGWHNSFPSMLEPAMIFGPALDVVIGYVAGVSKHGNDRFLCVEVDLGRFNPSGE